MVMRIQSLDFKVAVPADVRGVRRVSSPSSANISLMHTSMIWSIEMFFGQLSVLDFLLLTAATQMHDTID